MLYCLLKVAEPSHIHCYAYHIGILMSLLVHNFLFLGCDILRIRPKVSDLHEKFSSFTKNVLWMFIKIIYYIFLMIFFNRTNFHPHLRCLCNIISILNDVFTWWPVRLYYSMSWLPLWQLLLNPPATHYHKIRILWNTRLIIKYEDKIKMQFLWCFHCYSLITIRLSL